MIKFFRHIRQSMLAQGRITRYLTYAVGEIVLVVIGILIALQINIWNENRKLERLEVVLLQEMQDNLRADILDAKGNVKNHEKVITSANVILFCFENDHPPNDSLNKYYGKVSLVPKFLNIETAYRSFEKEGLRSIRNDSLRNAIIDYYEQTSQFMADWNLADWDMQFQDYRDVSRKFFKKFQVLGEQVPADYSILSSSQEYRNFLNNKIGWAAQAIKLYEGQARSAQALIEQIEEELNARRQ